MIFSIKGSVLDVTAEPKSSFLHTLVCVCVGISGFVGCFWMVGVETKTLAF